MKRNTVIVFSILLFLLILSVTFSLCAGALTLAPKEIAGILVESMGINTNIPIEALHEDVLLTLRLPRVLLSIMVGAALAVSGVTLQSIFRNPLVDSGLIGIASGAYFFATLYIVLGAAIPFLVAGNTALTLAVVAFLGAVVTTTIVYRISRFRQSIQITLLILAGVALNAITGALTGLMTYFASESELRDMTFWTLGSLGGATWGNLAILTPFIVIPLFFVFRISNALDAFALGEQSAHFLGIDTKRTKLIAFLTATAMVGASVSFVGSIGFIGLVIPHILRPLIGSNHRTLIPLSALAGAVLLCISDLVSRTILLPTEVPVGIITALFGTPVLLVIILNQKKRLFV